MPSSNGFAVKLSNDRIRIVVLFIALLSLVALAALSAIHWHEYAKSWVYAVCAFLVLSALGVAPRELPSENGVACSHSLSPRERRRILALGSLSLLCACLSHILFISNASLGGYGWFCSITGLVLLVAAFWPFRNAQSSSQEPFSRQELLSLLCIFVIAGAFRFYELTSSPYGVWFDEAQNALEASRILHRGDHWPTFVADLSQMPAIFFYYVAGFFLLFGESTFALRLSTTVAAMVSIISVWYFVRTWWGKYSALAAALFLAISRWHVNFSRFGMSMIFTTLLVTLAAHFLLRALNSRSIFDACAAGIVLGIGLQFYYSMIIIPAVFLIVIGAAILQRQVSLPHAFQIGFVLVFSLVLAYGPVISYAFEHWTDYTQRFRAASIVKVPEGQSLTQFLLRPSEQRNELLMNLKNGIVSHLQMFHVAGDRNGRHNFPGAPMLDPVTGVFLLVGMAIVIPHLFQPKIMLLFLWFLAFLSSGILSLDFEAPTAARTLGAVVPATIFAGLGWAHLVRQSMERGSSKAASVVVGIMSVGLLVIGAGFNWITYFDRQLKDYSAWASFSTAETRIGEVLRGIPESAVAVVPESFTNSPVIRFVSGTPLRKFEMWRQDLLPLPPDGPATILFFAGESIGGLPRVRQLYPGARIESFELRQDGRRVGDPILWIARLEEKDRQALRGLSLKRWASNGDQSETIVTGASWDCGNLPACWTKANGTIKLDKGGDYELAIIGADKFELRVMGEEAAIPASSSSWVGYLPQGAVPIEIEAHTETPGATVSLKLKEAGVQKELPISNMLFGPRAGFGVLGTYYSGKECEGISQFERIDPSLSIYFHLLPLPRPYAVRWTAELTVPDDGEYEFSAQAIDAAVVEIDGMELVRTREGEGAISKRVLSKGSKRLSICYYAEKDYNQFHLKWRKPGAELELIDPGLLRPTRNR